MATHKIAHSRNGQNGTKKTPIDEAPLNRITIMATIAVFGGIFLDGHILGVIGHAVAPAATELALSPIVTGLIAASALIGIFIGGSIFGRFADRFGRKKVFFWSLMRSEEHTSELQSRGQLVCRLLLEKKKTFPAQASLTTARSAHAAPLTAGAARRALEGHTRLSCAGR